MDRIVAFVGVPAIYNDRLLSRARKELTGVAPLSVPLQPQGGGYRISEEYLERCALSIIRHMRDNAEQAKNGIAFVMVLREWDDGIVGLRQLFPFGLVAKCQTPVPVHGGRDEATVANFTVKEALFAAGRALRALSHLVGRSRERGAAQNPFYLPVKNFTSQFLRPSLANLQQAVFLDQAIDQMVGGFLDEFKSLHPSHHQKGHGRFFVDDDNKWFKGPGRNLHGGSHLLSGDQLGEHAASCVLNAKFRLGILIADGFHFDCTKEGDVLAGAFANCHDAKADYVGNPHLNIHPNDYVRK